MGFLLQAQGEYAKAEPFYRDALGMNQKLYPKTRYPDGHPHLASSLNNLGFLLNSLGEYAKAEPFLRDALAMNQKLYPKIRYPDGHPELALSLYNLGLLLNAQGEHAKADAFLRDALDMDQAQLRSFAELKSEAEALNRFQAIPLTRDVFLTISRELPPRAEHYEPLWQGKSALTRIFERRHLDTLASTDDETRALALDLRIARERLARLTVGGAETRPPPEGHCSRAAKRRRDPHRSPWCHARGRRLRRPHSLRFL
jgi:tetratricopeptide (TPR) repeat protein